MTAEPTPHTGFESPGYGELVRFAGSLTRDEYLQAEKLMQGKTIAAWQVSLLAAGWAALAGVLAWLGQQPIPALMMLVLGLMLGGVTKLWYAKAVEWDRNPEYRKHYYGTLGERGIDTYGSDSWLFMPWSEWTEWNADNNMLVVVSPRGGRILPMSHFDSTAEWEAACALCARYLVKTAPKS